MTLLKQCPYPNPFQLGASTLIVLDKDETELTGMAGKYPSSSECIQPWFKLHFIFRYKSGESQSNFYFAKNHSCTWYTYSSTREVAEGFFGLCGVIHSSRDYCPQRPWHVSNIKSNRLKWTTAGYNHSFGQYTAKLYAFSYFSWWCGRETVATT